MKKTPRLQPTHVVHILQAAFDAALNEGLHHQKNDPSRVERLRLSSFPFCGVRWFLDLPRSSGKTSFIQSSMKYFTSVGHVMHDVMQKALVSVDLEAIGIELYGDWKCHKCQRMFSLQRQPKSCPSCKGTLFHFEEVTIDEGIVMGHIDTLFKVRFKQTFEGFDSSGVFVVSDYKTTSLKNLNSPAIPYIDNQEQIRAYANELHRKGKPVAPFAFLIYMPRDNPWKYRIVVVAVDFAAEEKKRARYIKRYGEASSVVTAAQLKTLTVNRPCRKGSPAVFKECRLAGQCAGEANTEHILAKVEAVRKKLKDRLPILNSKESS